MNFDPAVDDERVILDGRQRWTVHETAVGTRYGALGRAHPATDFLLRQAGSETGYDMFIGQR